MERVYAYLGCEGPEHRRQDEDRRQNVHQHSDKEQEDVEHQQDEDRVGGGAQDHSAYLGRHPQPGDIPAEDMGGAYEQENNTGEFGGIAGRRDQVTESQGAKHETTDEKCVSGCHGGRFDDRGHSGQDGAQNDDGNE